MPVAVNYLLLAPSSMEYALSEACRGEHPAQRFTRRHEIDAWLFFVMAEIEMPIVTKTANNLRAILTERCHWLVSVELCFEVEYE